MNARLKLDALHAEMLGDLQEVLSKLHQLQMELPLLMANVKKDGEEAAAVVRQSCDDFQAQAFALAEFIKLRKSEVLHDIEQSTVRNAITTKKALGTFRRSLWVIGAIAASNLAVTLLVILVLQK